jgi:hypothetical protein
MVLLVRFSSLREDGTGAGNPSEVSVGLSDVTSWSVVRGQAALQDCTYLPVVSECDAYEPLSV